MLLMRREGKGGGHVLVRYFDVGRFVVCLCERYPYSIFMRATLIPPCCRAAVVCYLPFPLSHITGVRTGGQDGSQRRQLQSHSPAGISAEAPLERLGGKWETGRVRGQMNVEWGLGGCRYTSIPCSHPPKKAPSVNPPYKRLFFILNGSQS